MNFRQFLTEGTTASIVVKTGDDQYSISYLQYDGSTVGPDLSKNFEGKKALELVSKSGEIASINGNKIEFYNDKKMLKTNLSEKQAKKEANNFGDYIYYYDGKNWYMSNGKIKSLDSMNEI